MKYKKAVIELFLIPGLAVIFTTTRTNSRNCDDSFFFFAFFPQFVNPEARATVIQFLVLGIVFVLVSITYTTLFVIGASDWRIYERATEIGRWGAKSLVWPILDTV